MVVAINPRHLNAIKSCSERQKRHVIIWIITKDGASATVVDQYNGATRDVYFKLVNGPVVCVAKKSRWEIKYVNICIRTRERKCTPICR